MLAQAVTPKLEMRDRDREADTRSSLPVSLPGSVSPSSMREPDSKHKVGGTKEDNHHGPLSYTYTHTHTKLKKVEYYEPGSLC